MKSVAKQCPVFYICFNQLNSKINPLASIRMIHIKYLILLLLFYGTTIWRTFAHITLPKLISDGMVLQREQAIRIWGWAAPQEKVSVKFRGHEATTITNAQGKWQINLPALPAGGPYDMEIHGENSIIINDILLGDVWFCSGQSNMELPISRVEPKYSAEIAVANDPFIRQFNVPLSYSFSSPADDVKIGTWKAVTPKQVLAFSAVGYFFAKELNKKLNIPIGIIKCAVGGSPIEAWLSEDVLQKYPDQLAKTHLYKDSSLVNSIKKTDEEKIKNWRDDLDSRDQGVLNKPKWYDTTYSFTAKRVADIPGNWDEQNLFADIGVTKGKFNGSVWFKKEIEITDSRAIQHALLVLGRIVDSDEVYVNGTFVGSTGYQYPPRRYTIPNGVLKRGKNTIVIRVISQNGQGAFIADKDYKLKTPVGTIDLKGEWSYQVGCSAPPFPNDLVTFQYQPAGLFNGMASPIFQYNIKGILWYQGESNIERYQSYQALLGDLISEWRSKWNNPHLPFLYVQLPNYNPKQQEPEESQWASLREVQRQSLAIPNTGMAVAIDLGEWNDIHPLDKKNIAQRLALLAFKTAYHQRHVIAHGPTVSSWQVKHHEVILHFDTHGSALKAKATNKSLGFCLAGSDGKFVWAKSTIKGNSIILSNPSIQRPVWVRYAWADNPVADIYNIQGLPATPFEIKVVGNQSF